MDGMHFNNYSERLERVINEYEKGIARQLNEEYIRETKWSDRLADHIASFGGSWNFIVLFALALAAWIVLNTSGAVHPFDPAPFILLNLMLSFIAAFQAPVIMMSQNRQAARDKQESLIDFAINFRAGKEIDDMQRHLHRIEREVGEIKQMLLAQSEKEDE